MLYQNSTLMMKRFIAWITLPLIVYACGGPEKYDISGNIKDMNKVNVSLQKTRDGEWTNLDSAQVEYGEFSFTGKLNHPQMMRLQFGEQMGSVNFFAENSDIQVIGHKDSLQSIEVKGSEVHNQYEQFQNKLEDYNRQLQNAMSQYRKATQNKDQEAIEQSRNQYQSLAGERQDYMEQYVEEHSNSVLAPYLARRHLLSFIGYEKLDSLYGGLAPEVQKTKYGEALKERLDILNRTQVGQPFIDFTLPDTSGNPVSLSEYVGEGYVLLDFWAAWCGPCRQENPNLVDAYEKYHDQGFEIFGVSFDRSKDAWVKAIHKDNITWPQVSDLEYWDSKAGEKYGIRSIPSNFLINEEGKIVGKNLRGEELEKKLSEIYNDEN